jgi:hypothetical protein
MSGSTAGDHGDTALPLGLSALEFIAHGVPIGEQRSRALAACRNLLAVGTSTEDTIDLIWQGLERSPQESGRRPWTRADAVAIVLDLERQPAPPLQTTDAELTRALSERRVRRVLHIDVR